MSNVATPRTVAATVTADGALAAGKQNPVDATSGARTMTLPTGKSSGASLSVVKVDASTNAVAVTGNIRGTAAQTINLTSQYELLSFVADSTGSWWPEAGHRTKATLDATYANAAALATKGDSRASYLGPVANRCRIPAGVISSSTYRQYKTWRVHRATERIDALELVYPGFTGLAENSATAPGVVSAVVEYPVGTFTRIKTNATIPVNGMSAVAPLTTLTTPIPVGARFWVGTLVTWDAALQAPRYQDGMSFDSAAATAMRESAQASATVSLTDDLMTGTRANGSISTKTGDSYGPCAILGMTQKPTVFIAGDSRAMGQLPPTTSAQDAEGIVGEVEQLLGNRVGYINAALNSDYYGQANGAGAYTNRLALSAYCTHIIDQYGVNSIYGQAVAQNTTDFTTFRNKFPAGKPYFKTTTTPKVTGNMILADLSDQTPFVTLANYTGWNTLVRNGLNGLIDGCIDLEAVTSANVNSGKVVPAQRVVTDGAMTASSGVLTSATANFQPGDVGKFVAVPGAATGPATLFAVISVVTNTTTVTLTANDSSAITNNLAVTGAMVGIGLSSYDGVHQTRVREAAIRESQLLQRVIGPILNSNR